MASSFLRFLDHTQLRTTVGRIPLDEWSARRRDLYLTTHSTHNRQTSMSPVGFETTISAGERPQASALDRAATGAGTSVHYPFHLVILEKCFTYWTLIFYVYECNQEIIKDIHKSDLWYSFDIHGSVHRILLCRNTNKIQLVIEFIIPKFIEASTCFERHIAHHQEL